ncbi:rhodanese-like domain-containing protein [Oceanihabitans sp. 2_MG-2023]|uniref:sulfurtransferase n=1 Tax=Oceanihabitans sp. 2_MG-2023 TaxID=3062661 RepID=UPI0026E3F6E6|nr:rhodanese-like domain-containing protein [Oceanihabitans sp. 2_MG-2023]MDO6598034.1 rhodanese-like domain-containing protein [Oceanihabitans sp. 2_MG-2023]
MNNLIIETPIVSTAWLHEKLNASNLVILNGTIPKIEKGVAIFPEEIQIPNTRFFDIKKKFSNINDQFPSAFPSEEQFTNSAQELGINKDTAIVVYDEKGIYSSARVWWLFKAFGYTNVAVLNGGFPEWKQNDFPTEIKQIHKVKQGDFEAKLQPGYMLFFQDILKIQEDQNYTILDARATGRFCGDIPEPREGLRSGSIPNSKNLPFEDLLVNHKLVSKDKIKSIFKKVTLNEDNLVFSCGSGITACVLALGAELIGYKNMLVYDGSWTEYGSLVNKEKTMHWTKNELVAYTLLYAANSNFEEDNKERNLIIEKVNMQTFQKIHDEFDADNDYQSIQKIQAGLKEHHFNQDDVNTLLAEIKKMFFADGEFDVYERAMYRSLSKLLSV